jgi:AcrR family transcriptional regulator
MARVPADVRRGQLVDAAIRVMVRDGVARATTRAIVAEADMRLGVFHYCFRSKAELFEQVIGTITGHTLEPALGVFDRGGTPEEQLQAGLRAYWQHLVDDPEEHRLTYELTTYASRDPELVDVARMQCDSYVSAVRRLLEAFAERNAVTWAQPLPALVRYVSAMIDGVTLLYLNERDADLAWAALELAGQHVAAQVRD